MKSSKRLPSYCLNGNLVNIILLPLLANRTVHDYLEELPCPVPEKSSQQALPVSAKSSHLQELPRNTKVHLWSMFPRPKGGRESFGPPRGGGNSKRNSPGPFTSTQTPPWLPAVP